MDKNVVAYIVSMRSGLEAFIYREVEFLQASGLKVHLFATKFQPADVYSPKTNWSYDTASLKGLLANAPAIFAGLLTRPRLLLEAIRDRALIDLILAYLFVAKMRTVGVRQIHCHFGDHKLFIGYYCKRLTGLPLSVTLHAHEFYTNPNERLFRKALLACDRIFPIASKWSELLVRKYGIPRERIRLNRLFVDVDINTPKSGVTVLAVGRFTPRKGFDYLLDAASRLLDHDIHFVFVGFGVLDIEAMARERNVDHRVTVFGKLNQAQLRVLYQSADILCVPSITTDEEGAEGIPVVLMEGMAAGLPVVATRCGAIDEIVEDNLVDERSVAQLAEAIRVLALDPGLRKRQGVRNREIVRDRYSPANARSFLSELNILALGS